MAYEWFNNSVYNPLNSFTPSIPPMDVPYPSSPVSDMNSVNTAARAATEAWASPFSTAFGGSAPSTTLDYVREFASPFSDVFGGTAPATPYSPSQMTPPVDIVTDKKPKPDDGGGGGKTPPPPPATKSLGDAQFDIMIGLMARYNIANLADAFGKIRKDYPGISSAEAMDLLRYDPRYNADYTKRFAGNTARAKNGFGMLDEKTYLEMEQGYSKVFKNYDLATFDNTAQYESLIGSNVDVVEAGKRVSLAYDRVLHSDPGTLNAWAKFYPQLSTADLVSIMLDPKNQLGIMERKVQSSEIGGAALTQGLNASLAAETIQSQRYSNLTTGTIGADVIRDTGETKAMAGKDYETISGQLPRAEFLSSIYANQGLAQYGQVEAEKATILGLASEKRKAEDLAAREAANLQGSSGTSKGAFSTSYLNRQGKSGAF